MFTVTEYFTSINGEGPRAGETAVFIRFRGCNLCCSYCDTRWSCTDSAPARLMTADDLVDMVIRTGITNVTLTGGEPLLQKELPSLCDTLIKCGRRVEIETNGSLSLRELAEGSHRPVFTMDYKLPSSDMEDKMCVENFSLLKSHDTVKMVAGDRADLDRAREVIGEFDLLKRCHVYLSPSFGKIDPKEMVAYMIEHKLNDVRLQLQLHKYIWEPDKRGV